jgi:carboxymethylenebutenolidase
MAGEPLEEHNSISSGFVSFAGNGTTLDGYLTHPSDGQAHPGVILIQEWWGIEPHVQDLTERLARAGYVVLAPDLYHGRVVTEPDEAEKAMMALNKDVAVDEIIQAIGYLRSRSEVQPKQLGLTGFCMGGFLTWRAAERAGGELAAIAPFYAGSYKPTAEDIRLCHAPALVIWGSADASIPASQREHIIDLLTQENKTFKAIIYPAGHAFMNDQHPTHNKAAAEDAWTELLGWFGRYLG